MAVEPRTVYVQVLRYTDDLWRKVKSQSDLLFASAPVRLVKAVDVFLQHQARRANPASHGAVQHHIANKLHHTGAGIGRHYGRRGIFSIIKVELVLFYAKIFVCTLCCLRRICFHAILWPPVQRKEN